LFLPFTSFKVMLGKVCGASANTVTNSINYKASKLRFIMI